MEDKQEHDAPQIDRFQQEWKKLEDKVREKPHQAVLVVFCAGLLAGALLKRGS